MNNNKQVMASKISHLFPLVILSLIGILLVTFTNYQIISAWFGKTGPANLGSIEVSYVWMAKFISRFGLATWSPSWYLGFPFHLVYTPLLPILTALSHTIGGIDLWQGYRLWTGIGYIFSAVSVFFLGWFLAKKFTGGIIAAILYSVGPTIFYFLFPEVAADRISIDFWDPRRFTILVRWGEGPHTLSLLFVPLVGVFFGKFLFKRKFRYLLGSSIFLGLAALTNAIGLFSSILLIAVMVFVKFAQAKKGKHLVPFGKGLVAGILSLGLISFWYNLSFIGSFFKEGGGTAAIIKSLFPWGWIGLFFIICIVYFLFRKVIKDFGLAVSILWAAILFSVIAIYYGSAPVEEASRRLEVLPQALRYMTEADMAIALLLGVGVSAIMKLVERSAKLPWFVDGMIGIAVAIVMIVYVQPFRETATNAAGNEVDLTATSEYRVSKWLSDNTDSRVGERVFVPGDYGFYLNWFSDVWQARGALFQAATNKWVEHLHYQLANGDDPEIARAWLSIINAKYAVITTPGSDEMYKEIKNLDRFTQFEPVSNLDGNIIYKTNFAKTSQARTIDAALAQKLLVPKKGDDKEALITYANWSENSGSTDLDFKVLSNEAYNIKGTIGANEAILVKMTYDSGWHALLVNAQGTQTSLKVSSDPMGFILIKPNQAGEVEISLTHGRKADQWMGYVLTAASVSFVIWYIAFGRVTLAKRNLVLGS